MLTKRIWVAILLFCMGTCWGETGNPKPALPSSGARAPHRGDIPDLLRETQLGVRVPHHTGLVWYIPFEFWLESAAQNGQSVETTSRSLESLKSYTLVVIFAAKVGGLGGLDFIPPSEMKKNVFLRDSQGNDFAALEEVSPDAQNLSEILKPVFANALGRAGENATLLFFPAKNKAGLPIADPQREGRFSVVLKSFLGIPEDIYEWRLPLTSLSPAKYCPEGNEQVNANWKYCPWHGVKLATQNAGTEPKQPISGARQP